jgi:hypothetical protein
MHATDTICSPSSNSGPCQPSHVYRYLRTLEGISPPLSLAHLNCQTTAKAFVATRLSSPSSSCLSPGIDRLRQCSTECSRSACAAPSLMARRLAWARAPPRAGSHRRPPALAGTSSIARSASPGATVIASGGPHPARPRTRSRASVSSPACGCTWFGQRPGFLNGRNLCTISTLPLFSSCGGSSLYVQTNDYMIAVRYPDIGVQACTSMNAHRHNP